MELLKFNGLSKTPGGQMLLQQNTQGLVNKDSQKQEIRIKDCIVTNVRGIGTFKSHKYTSSDEGSLLIDLVFPKGMTIDHLGKKYQGVQNVRCRQSYEALSLEIGLLEEDFIFKTGDLIVTVFEYENIQMYGEFVFSLKSKEGDALMGNRQVERSLYTKPAPVPNMSVLHGGLNENGVKAYQEMYREERLRGGYV